MSTVKTATYTNDDGDTYAYDPRVIVEGATVRAPHRVSTHRPGDEEEVIVYEGATGTVLDYAEPFYQCLVRLDGPTYVAGTDVWVHPDELVLVTPRYVLDRDEAARVLPLIEAMAADVAFMPDDFDAIPKDHHDDAGMIGLDGFDPGADRSAEGAIAALIRLAWALWLTGPAEPSLSLDNDGDCYAFEARLGQYPGRVRLSSGWEDAKHIVDRDPEDDFEHVTNTAAALSILDNLVMSLNSALTELDNYVAAEVAKQPDPYSDLLDAVTTDFEREVLDGLRRKAGIVVECACGWDVGREQDTCDGCGQPREAADETAAA